MRKILRAALLASGCLSLVIIAGFGLSIWWAFAKHEYRGAQISLPKVQGLEPRLKLHIPSSANFQYLSYYGGGFGANEVVFLKFTLPHKDVAALIASSPFADRRFTAKTNYCSINSPPVDWDVDAAQPFVSAYAQGSDGDLMMTIAHPDSETPTIYLYLYEAHAGSAKEE